MFIRKIVIAAMAGAVLIMAGFHLLGGGNIWVDDHPEAPE